MTKVNEALATLSRVVPTRFAGEVVAVKAEMERLREGMSEISEIVSDFYTEQDGIKLPKNLSPIAGELRVIHSIAMEASKDDGNL